MHYPLFSLSKGGPFHMAIIYGNAISIGYATSGATTGGLYSIWLTIPSIASSVTFTAVKGDVSVDSKYISSIGAAKITLPTEDYEGEWSISGIVSGKTAVKTITIKSGTVDYFVDFRNDFIPLVGDLAVGNLVTFDNKEWRVVHQEGTHYYLGATKINNTTIYGKTTAFTQATIFESATAFKDTLSAQALEYIVDITIEDTPCTVWIPSEDELSGGFSYFTGTDSEIADKRKLEFGTSGNMPWWTRSNRSAGGFYKRYVTATGTFSETSSLDTTKYGFVPFICIKYYPIGFDFIYTGTCNIRTDGVVEFLTSGDFIPSESQNIDAFLVGGGSSGCGGNNASSVKYAGGGGSGGYTLTKKNISITANTNYNIQIGAGGIATEATSALTTSVIRPGGDTAAFGFTASGGKGNSSTATSTTANRITGGDGGCGGGSGSSSTNDSNGTGGSNGNNGGGSSGGKGQGSSTCEFGEATGKLYAGGGGGGQYSSSPINKGGEGGGGNGANSGNAATTGTPNTGGGGGGGSVSTNYNGASGGSGIVCIRLHQENIKRNIPDFNFTGKYNIRDDDVIEILDSGNIIFNEEENIDIFLVGGGAAGSETSDITYSAGGGGAGGITKTIINTKVSGEYQLIIGEGGAVGVNYGAGGETAFGTLITAKGGTSYSNNNYTNGGTGGSGGGAAVYGKNDLTLGIGGSDGSNGIDGYASGSTSTSHKGGSGQGTTTREFGESSGKLYAAGGAGGRVYGTSAVVSIGGEGGGGNGAWSNEGNSSFVQATAGKDNTGSGGGGYATAKSSKAAAVNAHAASGGSGIICIRKTKNPTSDIPLTGDLAIGNTVTFDDKSFVVVHNEGTQWYLAKEYITDQTTFNSSKSATYLGSTLASTCDTYLAQFSDNAKKYMVDVTVNNVTNKVFIPSYEQVNGGFSYYNSNANRKVKRDSDNNIMSWWTSSGYNSANLIYRIVGGTDSDSGTITTATYDNVLGIRPHICIDTSLSGSDTKETVLNGTYYFNTTLTTPPGTSYTETVQYKYHNGTGGTYNYITFNSNSGALGMNYHYSSMDSYTSVYNYSTQKWLDDIYRTIIFDNQTVTEEFYDWFIANATIKS